ncbi:MAG TPA: penicillin acylase family protein [Stellaceae bacterium]|nr:penicillin acylase family protein [Stellaceae bacterium]
MRRFLKRRLLLLLPVLVVLGGFLWLRSSLPQEDGRLALGGLGGEVRISRDEHGIPTIAASTDRDTAFALGFVHAQDRLFQMDVMRRFGAGRLSEWFGPATLRADRFSRTLGLYRAAERQYALLSPGLRTALDAYAAGVNAYLAQHEGALPPEYQLLRVTPEPWRPADTLVWGKLMDLQLAGNFRNELLHARLAQHLTPEQLDVLYPSHDHDGAVTLGGGSAALEGLPLDAIYASLPPQVGPTFASNNWVVDGQHTVSGKPLLANDPHLGFSSPSVWYMARIATPDGVREGVTAPGGPFIVIGHNARIAWGFTTTTSDVEDLFIERVDPADATHYLTPEGSEAFGTRDEEIRVKGADTETITVRSTRHGPVISDLGGGYAEPAATGTVLALKATWLADDDRSPDALWSMDHAGNWQQFRDALKDFVAPQQNMVYADIDGHIGFIAPARVPIRAKGDGWMPAPGWNGEYEWTGFIPFDDLPQALDPPTGRFVSANNKIVPDSYPYFLGRGWDVPNRAQRINELLDATPKQSPEASAAIQADTLSPMARDLLPLMLQIKPASKAAGEALDRLKSWDRRMERDQTAPLIFAAWLRAFNRTILAGKLGNAFDDYWGMHPDVIRLILTEHQDWCENTAGEAAASCAPQLAAALEQALDELRQHYGGDMNSWQWGRAHVAQFTNQFWAKVPVVGGLIALGIPADGGYDTINRGATPVASPNDPYADTHGSTLRMIVDLSDIAASRFMIAPGQSGNPFSPHYGDLLQPWRNVTYLTLGKTATHTLVLAPP